MSLFKKEEKKKKKKKTIPKEKILKAMKDREYLDLGEPFGEDARRFLAFQIGKMIEREEIGGTLIMPEGVYLSISSTEVRDVIRLIKAKGICDLEELAKENNWNVDSIKLIARSRVELLKRTDGKVITRQTALDMLFQEVIQGVDVDLHEIAEELQLKKSVTRELLMKLINDEKVEGVYVKAEHKFLPIELLEESIKETVEEYERKKVKEVQFSEIAAEYGITEEHVYNILRMLQKEEEIEVQLNLGQRICILKANIEKQEFIERIPEEEKKLEIEDLTEKN